MPKSKTKDYTEFTRPGTVYRVFTTYEKGQLNKSGEKPTFIVPDEIEKKIKNKGI